MVLTLTLPKSSGQQGRNRQLTQSCSLTYVATDRRSADAEAGVEMGLVPTRDHAVAEQSKNYRYSRYW
ncbi:hypothetical protein ACFWBV_35440 [Streptomyces sp. NPDC060030]|uniref:hypothetical protein n=1 Tax=Streptomyces sp. NPDC060030 TaxID=3347042 RepID=UPI00369A66B6